MNQLLVATLLALAAIAFNTASAHGSAKPKHGGTVQTASDLSFELVGTADGAVIYVEDHGMPMVPTGFGGKLTVLSGTAKSEALIAVAGDRLEARGVQIAKGAKVVAALSTPGNKAITVRFTVR